MTEDRDPTPHELFVEMAELFAELDPLQDPEYWVERVASCPLDALPQLIGDILLAGHNKGRVEMMAKKFAADQNWIEEIRQAMGIKE